MERYRGIKVWRRLLVLQPLQLELFSQPGPDIFPTRGRATPSPTNKHGGEVGPLLRDVYPKVRGGVVCMSTAAQLHDMLPGLPTPLWLGVPLKVHVPRRDRTDLHVLRWSNSPAFDVGVERVEFRDITLLRTTRERTIVDLVRYGRHLGGSTIAARCLRAYSAAGGREADVRRMADAVRLPNPARVVLDALLAGMHAAP